jgi:hypothetical protein
MTEKDLHCILDTIVRLFGVDAEDLTSVFDVTHEHLSPEAAQAFMDWIKSETLVEYYADILK